MQLRLRQNLGPVVRAELFYCIHLKQRLRGRMRSNSWNTTTAAENAKLDREYRQLSLKDYAYLITVASSESVF